MALELNLDKIIEAWEADASVTTSLNTTLQDLSRLHAKYVRPWALANLKAKAEGDNLKVLRRQKYEWLAGYLTKEQLTDLGWTPFQRMILKKDYKEFIDAEPDVIRRSQVVALYDEIVRVCGTILEEIHQRSYSLSAASKHEMFLAGAS